MDGLRGYAGVEEASIRYELGCYDALEFEERGIAEVNQISLSVIYTTLLGRKGNMAMSFQTSSFRSSPCKIPLVGMLLTEKNLINLPFIPVQRCINTGANKRTQKLCEYSIFVLTQLLGGE